MNNKINRVFPFLHEHHNEIGHDVQHSKYQFSPDDPVETGFQWMLMLGRFLGVSPISVSFRRSGTDKVRICTFRWLCFSAIHSLLLTAILLLVFIPEILTCLSQLGTHPSILAEMDGMEDTIYRFSVVAMCIYSLRNASQIISHLHRWSATMKKLKLKTVDSSLPKFLIKVTIPLMGMCAAENILYTTYRVHREDQGDIIEQIYKATQGYLATILPHYSIFTSGLLIYAVTTGVYCWHFADLHLIVMCRALSHKFNEINEELQSTLYEWQKEDDNLGLGVGHNMKRKGSPMNQPFQMFDVGIGIRSDFGFCPRREPIWKGIRDKITSLCCLTEEIAGGFHPIVLSAYVYNIFLIILNIIRFIYESEVLSLYVYVSTLEYAMRVVLVTYYAAEVYHSPEKILKTLERYPDSVFSPTACGLERMLARHPVGVKLFDTVPLTRKTFVSILTFLFTAEIVLLQAMSAGSARNRTQ